MSDDQTLAAAWPSVLATFLKHNNAELLATIEYLRLENQLLRARLPGRLVFTPVERSLLATAARTRGKFFRQAVSLVKPETILKWNAQLKRLKWTQPATVCAAAADQSAESRWSTHQRLVGLILRFAGENRRGYARIGGELRQLGLTASKTYVKKILHRLTASPSKGIVETYLGRPLSPRT